MSDVDQKVGEQYEKFEKELPTLLQTHPGKWVVYLDGVQGIYDDDDAARRAAIKRYGLGSGFVIAPVQKTEPVLVTAAFAYRLGTT